MRSRKIVFGTVFVAFGVLIGLLIAAKLDISPVLQCQSPAASAPAPSFEGYRMEDAIINVANTSGKAVVSISTEHVSKMPKARRYYFGTPFGGESPYNSDDPFRSFFDDFFGALPEREFKQAGLGSGVIIDPEGYILTNEHVIDDADKITVTLSDGREFQGEVKGSDPRSDLAVIKINARNLPIARLGDSDSVRIGQWVVAIGNPFGFALESKEPTVTVGVISALHRSLGRTVSREKDYNDLIQTDAAINPGNSGGPLVNLKGEIVGVNVAIFSTSGGYQGVGFAIPINNAKRILSKLIEGKKILYGWLGVTVQDLTDDLVKYFGLTEKTGVLVAKVLKLSPAERAGIKESDCIVEFDGKPVKNVKDLLSFVGRTEVGKKVKLKVIREKKELAFELLVAERPKDIDKEVLDTQAEGWRGLEVENINPANSQRYRLEEREGVVVVAVQPASPAEEATLLPGDVILEINKQKVKNTSDYQKITSLAKGNVLVRTQRGYFIIKPGEK